jgi:hypothetical protein
MILKGASVMVLFFVAFFGKSCLIFENGAERASRKIPFFSRRVELARAVAIADQVAASVTTRSIGMGECKVMNAIKSFSFD